MNSHPWRMRTYLSGLLTLATLVTTLAVGGVLLLYKLPELNRQSETLAQSQATAFRAQQESLLAAYTLRMDLLARLLQKASPAQRQQLLDETVAGDPSLSALYLVSDAYKVTAVGADPRHGSARREWLGLDLSRTSLITQRQEREGALWSDKFLSPLTGNIAVGLSQEVGTDQLLVAEVLLADVLAGTTRGLLPDPASNANPTGAHVWVLDSRGEILVDSEDGRWAGRLNLKGHPAFLPEWQATGGSDWRSPDGVLYRLGVSGSSKLRWLFVARVPIGWDSPPVRAVTVLLALSIFGTLVVGLALAPLWANHLTRQLRKIIKAAELSAQHRPNVRWPTGRIAELNELAHMLHSASSLLLKREDELVALNQDLEQRVQHRTADLRNSNEELKNTLDALGRTQQELVRAEKLASLGGLVAGVAHELNTPIGNGLMAVTTLEDETKQFVASMNEGLRRSALERFVQQVQQANVIAHRNLGRASELVTSFKQVAVDQTTSQRRRFKLAEVVDEVLVTLRPTLKRTDHLLQVDLPTEVDMDSYPGELGQIVVNLVMNALIHAFEHQPQGTIRISAHSTEPGQVTLSVEDNGCGIPPELLGRVFDPFVTSRMGRGGTGLGLNIAFNAAAQVLGGKLSVSSTLGQGTRFNLQIPLVAPVLNPTVDTR